MKVITVTIPDGTPFNMLQILDLIEPGASGHALMTERLENGWIVRHSRLGVQIKEQAGVRV